MNKSRLSRLIHALMNPALTQDEKWAIYTDATIEATYNYYVENYYE